MRTSTLARADLAECERIGRETGLAAGLASALSGISVADTAPGRYAAVPAAGPDDGAAVLRHRLADAEGVVFLECPGRCPEAGPTWTQTGRLLAAVRLGVLRAALDQAVEHLSGRLSGGEPLIRKQLITGAIADIMAGTEMVRAYAQTQGGPAALADIHTRLDTLGWEVLKLFGAAGYLADSPGRALYVSALVAGTWVPARGGAAGMIELDDDLRAARDATRELAEDLRGRALAVDADPEAMDEHLNSDAFEVLRISETPMEFRESQPGGPRLPNGARLPDRGNCLTNAVSLIEAARGDMATVLACPAPGLPRRPDRSAGRPVRSGSCSSGGCMAAGRGRSSR